MDKLSLDHVFGLRGMKTYYIFIFSENLLNKRQREYRDEADDTAEVGPDDRARHVKHDIITKCPAETNSVGFSITGDGTVKHGWNEVTCYRACGPIVVDGHLDGPSWQEAPWTDLFGHLEEPAVVPFLATRARML